MINSDDIKVGTVLISLIPCMYNPIGTRAVCYENYGGGFSFIFPNGEYCGFAMREEDDAVNVFFKEKAGDIATIQDYKFKNVMQLCRDFEKGRFAEAFSNQNYD